MNAVTTSILLVTFACSIANASRAADAPLPIESIARETPVDFEKEILPILRANCSACHNEKKAEANLVLESPASILKGGEQGPAVVAGKGAESLLLKVAAHQEESFMPPPDNLVGANSLTANQLGLLKLWIDQGASGSVSASRRVRWQPLPQGFAPIFATAVTTDGKFAACGRGNRLFAYHLPSNSPPAVLSDSTLTGDSAHADVVRALSFNQAGTLLASGGFREVKLWRVPRVERLAAWKHDAPLTTVAVSADGLMAATGDETGAMRLWELKSGKTLHTIGAHKGAITGLAFSPDGAAVYSASLDKSLRAWHVEKGTAAGKPVETASPVHALALIQNGERLVSGEADGHARVWEIKALRDEAAEPANPVVEIKAHTGALTSLASIPMAPGEFLSGGDDGFVRRWNAETGKQISELKSEGPVAALAVRPDGRRIAAAGAGYVRVWSGDDGKPLALLQGDPRLAEKVAEIDAQITFTKSAVALAKQDIKLYEGVERRVMTTAEEVKKAEAELVKVEKTRDEKKQAVEKAKADNKDAKAVENAEKALADAETAVVVAGTVIERSKGVAERAVKNLADAQAAVATKEELQKQQEAAKDAATTAAKAPRGFSSLAFSTDGSRLAAGAEDGALHFFDAGSGLYAETHAAHTGAANSLAFAPDGTLVSASADRRTFTWNAGSQWRLLRTIGLENPAECLVDRVLALDFSPDGKHLATGGGLPSNSGELKIWNVVDGRLVGEFKGVHADTIFSVRYSPDGKHLATASADRLVKVTNVESSEAARTFAGHTAHALGVSWKGDGKQLVSCGGDNVLKQWDFETGLPVRTMKGTTYQIGSYKREVTAVSFIGESEQILATSGDGTVRLHRTSSENDILVFKGASGYQYAVAATPDGRIVLSGGADGVLRLWSGHVTQVKQSFP